MQPGDTITPEAQAAEPAEQQPAQPVMPQQPVQDAQPEISPAPAPPTPQPITAEPTLPTLPSASEYTAPVSDDGGIRWTASEYIDHGKGSSWFVLMGVCLFVLVVATYFVLRDVVAPILLALAGITFGIFAGRRPQVLEYAVDSQGIHIGSRVHAFEDFKSFSLTDSGPLPSILLTPLRRFLPPITIFYDPKEEDRIVDGLSIYLPYEDKAPDVVDRLMSRIRF